MHLQGEVRREDLLWLLGSLCGLFCIPFDAPLIAQDSPPPSILIILHEAARALGIKTGPCSLANSQLEKASPAGDCFSKACLPGYS